MLLQRRIGLLVMSGPMRTHRVRWFASFPAHTKIILPALSPTMSEGGLATWKKKEGDAIKPGEVLCEIETDKATVDFEYQEEGVVAKQLVKEGTSGLKVGTVIGIVVDDAANVQAFANTSFSDFNSATPAAAAAPPPPAAAKVVVEKLTPPASPPQTGTTPPKAAASPPQTATTPPKAPAASSKPPAQATSGERVFASPLARRLAREQNKNLSSIKGTGPNGRILAVDVQEAKEQAPQAASATMEAGDQSWTLNKLNTPHYYLNVDVDLTEALAACEMLNKSRKDKTPITVNEFILRAAALSMRKVPEANAAWGDGGSFRMYDFCDVNFAVAMKEGNVRSPLLKGIHVSGLEQLATQVKDVESKLAKNESVDESPGTFSMTNLGSFGIKSIVPIIKPGQTTALGVGALRKALIPNEMGTGARVATVTTITLSCDHRVVDGAIGAEWLHAFKSLVEKPMSMLL